MFAGSLRSKGRLLFEEYRSERRSLMGNLSVSTPVTVITVSLRGGGTESRCCAYSMLISALARKKAVSDKAVLRIEVSFRTKGITLGKDSSDRLKCFLMLV